MDPKSLANLLQQYLADSPQAVFMEDGQVQFELPGARWSVASEHNKCVLQLWSDERSTVRRVLDAEEKEGALRLSVQRFGQSKPHRLEICRDRDRRAPAAKKAARAQYQRLLERVLLGSFPEYNVGALTSTMDLERSLSPVYVRGTMRRGITAAAVLGISALETQASVDASLTFALLWLDHCRQRETGRSVESLKIIAPAGRTATLRARMAHLDTSAARFELYELNEREESLVQLDFVDGNINTRLVQAANESQVLERFAGQVQRVRALVPGAQVHVESGSEIAFRYAGLEFARVRLALVPGSFKAEEQLVFGTAGREVPVTEDNRDEFERVVKELCARRHADGDTRDPLWRMAPERWLESRIAGDVTVLDPWLDPHFVYSQVPAFSAADRAMIDLLASTREGRLAVIELKADEDIHLPMQGLDYWTRVRWHQARGEFSRFGYFPGRELSPESPLLILVAPAMRVHPATDRLLQYLSPEIDWTLLGLDERWRTELRVVFRKRAARGVGR